MKNRKHSSDPGALSASELLRRSMLARARSLLSAGPNPPGPGHVLLVRLVLGRADIMAAQPIPLTAALREAVLEAVSDAERARTAELLDATAEAFVIVASDGRGAVSVEAVDRHATGGRP